MLSTQGPLLSSITFGPDPIYLTCPYCQNEIFTAVRPIVGSFTCLTCFLFFLVCPIGCWFLPCCLDAFKDVIHFCPNCGQLLEAVPFGPDPIYLTCPYCHTEIISSTRAIPGSFTCLSCFLFFLVCPIGCCLVPCCLDTFKDIIHFCPNCGNYLGEYTRC